VSWHKILDGVDAAESWIVGQLFWVQVPLLLLILVPLAWLVAGGIDKVIERILGPHTRRGLRPAAERAIARNETASMPPLDPSGQSS